MPLEEQNLMLSREKLNKKIMKIICDMYSDSKLCFAQIQKTVTYFQELLQCKYVNQLKALTIAYSKDSNKEQHICEEFDFFQNVSTDLNTDYLRLKYLEESKFYVKPEPIYLNTIEEPRKGTLNVKEIYGQVIPLQTVLKQFFELLGVFDKVQSHCDELQKNNEKIYNMIQTDFWKEKTKSYNGEIVYPLMIYEDAFETGNGMGFKAGIHKINGVYASVSCFPPEINSTLETIFLA